jgi:CheY-like chemotaxis protein
MKILIVDDNHQRRADLTNFFVEQCLALRQEIDEVDCVDAARRILRTTYYDALILDVVLPKRKNESPNYRNGINFLEQIARSPVYKKPEKIIGITAHIDDISRYRTAFEKYCFAVIEANSKSVGWKTLVKNSIGYTAASKFARSVDDKNLHVLTIHGIRTFGDWQLRLKQLVNQKLQGISFHSYKYGYFPVVDFLFPSIRNIEVRRLARHLNTLFDEHSDKRFIIFSHSFGTYLIAEALRIRAAEGNEIPVEVLVLSGSVLRENYNWNFAHKRGVRIVNDCADHDYVLYMSKMFVVGTGMAGKTGFVGFQDASRVNRYFLGGHSGYFKGNDFMKTYWLPLFNVDDHPAEVDLRKISMIRHGVIDRLVSFMGFIKEPTYLLLWSGILILLILRFGSLLSTY